MTDEPSFVMTHTLSPTAERSRRLQRASLIVTDYLGGRPLADICKEFDVSPALVCRYARDAGLTRYKRRQEQRPEIVADYAAGTAIAEICRKYEIDRKTVWVFAKAAGVPLRQPHQKKDAA